jgi:hypothetical protein
MGQRCVRACLIAMLALLPLRAMGDSVYTLALDPTSSPGSPIIVSNGTESSLVNIYLVETPDATGVYHLQTQGLSAASFDIDLVLPNSNPATILSLNGNSSFDFVFPFPDPAHSQLTEITDIGNYVKTDASSPGRLFLGSFTVFMPTNAAAGAQTQFTASAEDVGGSGRFVVGDTDIVSAVSPWPVATFEADGATAAPLPSAAAAGLMLVGGLVLSRRTVRFA